jgi:hypothetical protein
VLAAGFGVLVETTSTLHTYTFHRLTPKATEVTTVASISGDVTTVAGISANVTTVAGNTSNVTAVAGNASNINAVVANASNINTAATYLNNFLSLYLGQAATDPAVDPLGNGITTGDVYFNDPSSQIRVYNGAAWQSFAENTFGNTFFPNANFAVVYTAAAGSNSINLGDLLLAGGVFPDENSPTNRMSLASGTITYNLGAL